MKNTTMPHADRLKRLFIFLRNKFIITLLFFFVWLLFFDEYNLVSRVKNNKRIVEFEEQKERSVSDIERNKRLLQELQGDDDNLEKFAREQYLMKKDNEDIYIVLSE